MTTKLLFTSAGWARHAHAARAAAERVRAAGQEVGAEAGLACDWHDNFGFEEARRRLEDASEIALRLNQDMGNGVVVEVREQADIVDIGTTVSLRIGKELRTLTIGGWGEFSAADGLVTYTAPIVRGIMGLRVGDEAEVELGGTEVDVFVEEIRPPSHRYTGLCSRCAKEPS